jgi:hypothetical protein
MSLSAYDIFTRLDGGFEDEESSTASHVSEGMEEEKTEAENDDDDISELVSSMGSSENFDAISWDSAVLQELERSNVRAGGSHTVDGERTILSSAPSGAFIPPPEASQDVFALTPHPRFVTDGIRSISTTNTDYEYVHKDGSVAVSDASSVLSLSSINTRSTSCGGSRLVLRRAPPMQHGHEAAVFERIASQLLGESAASTLSQASPAHWYNKLVSESDWERFRTAAKDLLSVLEPKSKAGLLPLPPTPSDSDLRLANSNEAPQVPYNAEDHLPSDFICGLCKDVIVGACTLDCGCSSAVVCASCFESTNDAPEAPQDMSNQMGFVWIEDSERECPTCHGNVSTKVHCHALDVAILHIIRDLPHNDAKMDCLKRSYYSRLATWRATVYNRNETRHKQLAAQQDEMLARLIQEEERIFWNPKNQGHANNGILFLGQAAVALVAATIASIGFNVISRR